MRKDVRGSDAMPKSKLDVNGSPHTGHCCCCSTATRAAAARVTICIRTAAAMAVVVTVDHI